jgi:ABC-type phosphate transport system substrate-binding protein
MANMKLRFPVFALVVLVALAAHGAAFKVVVNSGIRIESMPKKSVSDLFMKRMTKWENGQAVVAVDQAEAATVRDEFSRSVHGKPTAAVKSYWNQQIFSGREVPPVEKQTDAEVLKFVRSTAGAVGYVSENAPTEGVRVIQVQ